MNMRWFACGLPCAVLLLSAARAGGGEPAPDLAALGRQLHTTESGDEKAARQAANALVRIGAPAVPTLIQAIGTNASYRTRRLAVQALAKIGPEAKDAIPALIPALQSNNLWDQASSALVSIGPAAVPPLIRLLEDRNNKARVAPTHVVIDILCRMGPAAEDAVPTLMQVWKDAESVSRRCSVLRALGNIGPGAKDALPLLVQVLQNPGATDGASRAVSPPERLAAASALARIGPGGVAALIKAGKDGDRDLRRSAAIALAQSNLTGNDAAAILQRANQDVIQDLQSTNFSTRGEAVFAVCSLGPAARETVPALLAHFDREKSETDSTTRTDAVADRYDIPVFDEEADTSDYLSYNPRADVAYALGHIGPGAKAAVPVLMRALQSGSKALRVNASHALGKIGPAAEDAVPALIKVLNSDSEPDAKGNALWALRMIGPAAKAAVPSLVELLEEEDSDERYRAAYALAKIGPAGSEAVSALISATKAKERPVRLCAAIALTKVVPANKEAAVNFKVVLREAVQDLRSTDDAIQLSAAWALGEMGAPAGAAIPQLAAAQKETRSEDLRLVIDEAMKKIGPAATGESLELTPAETEQSQAAKLRALAEDYVQHPDGETRDELGKFDPRIAVPVLLEELKKEMVRLVAKKDNEGAAWMQVGLVDEMVKLIQLAPEALPLLEAGLRDKRPEVRYSMLLAAERLGPLAKPAIAAIGALLKDERLGIRAGAARVLCHIGSEAVPLLSKAMGDADTETRAICVLELLEGTKDVSAKDYQEMVPVFRNALKDPSLKVRVMAAAALQRLQPEAAPECAAVFREGWKSSDKDIREFLSSGYSGAPRELQVED